LLQQGERCVTEIVAALHEKFSTVSQRLRLLRAEGLVVRRREGTHIYYTLADRHVADLIQNALAHAAELETAPASSTPEGD
jgi:DNA-binding transcriptional ArsR family regulator